MYRRLRKNIITDFMYMHVCMYVQYILLKYDSWTTNGHTVTLLHFIISFPVSMEYRMGYKIKWTINTETDTETGCELCMYGICAWLYVFRYIVLGLDIGSSLGE